jgi:L-alanine-DL-glutamate epimerase-like enolase superfamily enzyme
MAKTTDARVSGVALFFLPIRTRVPLKFGPEIVTEVTCARVRVRLTDRHGQAAEGWGETPLSAQWVWPSQLSFQHRDSMLRRFCGRLAEAWAGFPAQGHPMELGHDFKEHQLAALLRAENEAQPPRAEPLPWLAALVCCSAFDLAVHDAYGQLLQRDIYSTYGPEYMNRDLAAFLAPAPGAEISFAGQYPQDYLARSRPTRLRAWHLVGGLDALHPADADGSAPQDSYPFVLGDWIERDGLKCLKIKLRGNDWEWDYRRITTVGRLAIERGVEWLTADFNCTVSAPDYVNELLDRLRDEESRIYGMILYVEQPFPYDLERHRIDVHSLSARKPLFLDESAHDWRLIKLGRELGWTGVALKTCKTQSEAILSCCWAKAHGMALMVQDLTNPMLAQISHLLLGAHAGTIMGVETNSMQFYPDASRPEEAVHPGLYRRRNGMVDLSSICGPGFGYRLPEMNRVLPPPQVECR